MTNTRTVGLTLPARNSSARTRTLRLACVGAALLALVGSGSVDAQGTLGPLAPANLHCGPRSLPGDPAQWQWQWTWDKSADGLGAPHSVAIDAACNVYAADTGNSQIDKFSPDLTRQATIPVPGGQGENDVTGVAVDMQGNVYVAERAKNLVRKFPPSGAPVTWGECTPSASTNFCADDLKGPVLFNGPQSIAVDGHGDVYVVEEANARVQKLSASGQRILAWGGTGAAPGQFSIPDGVALDRDGNVYVADYGNNRIQKFSSSGQSMAQWGGPEGGDPGQFHGPRGIAVDLNGNMYVSDTQNWRVQELSSNGQFIGHWRNCLDGDPPCAFPDAGTDLGQFNVSQGLAVTGQSDLYVADLGNNRVQRFYATAVPVPVPGD
jgi:tripartite motif-containing protein 71